MNYLIVDPDAQAAGRFAELLACVLKERSAENSARITASRGIAEEELLNLTGTDTCLILEITITDPADGLCFAQQLREKNEDIPIVFCSETNDYAMQCYDLNITYYIQKPISEEKVCRMLDRIEESL